MTHRIAYDACPLCDSTDFGLELVGNCSRHALYKPGLPAAMNWMRCRACDHRFVDGYFTDEALALIFSGTHENQKVGYQIEQQRAVSARMVEKVLPWKSAGSWLDVGFGNGSLLFTAQEYGFRPVGVDLRRDNVAAMTALGIEAHCADLADIRFDRRFSVISLMDVLEHVPYPRTMLRTVAGLLEDDGVLLISMPNIETLLWTLLTRQSKNPYTGEIEHYHNFSRTRLYRLLRDHGIEPLRYGISERYRVCMEVVARKRA